MVVIVLSTLVTSIAYTIGLIEKIATTYAWLRNVVSKKWKEELEKYIKYLRVVKQVTRRYKNSNRSETSITGALQLLDGELKESWSKVDKWIQTKQLSADDFMKELNSSRTTISQNLQLFSTAVQTCRDVEAKSQREKEKEREKKREETEYKAWLSENVTKLTDSWTRYKERATNSKLDSAKKERLFRKHMEGLREKYLRGYRQLLKEVIKPESEKKYLTSWSAAERLLQGHQRFDQFPQREREREWSSHVKHISKKSHKTK